MKQEERDQLLIKIVNGQEELFKRQEKTDAIINKILQNEDKFFKRQEKTDAIINKILQNQDKLFKGQEKTDVIINKILQNQDKLFKGQEDLSNNQEEIKEELTRLGNTVAKIEYEHGTKIDLILDVLTGHAERLEEYRKRFEEDEKIIEMQGYQIFGIEQKNKL